MPNGENTSETPGQIGTKGKDKIIQEIITHINTVEEKINTFKESVEETKDLQTVNKLDIINLKNELEQIKLSIPTISPESAEKIRAMEKLAEKIEKAEEMGTDIDKLKSDMKKLKPVELKNLFAALDMLQQKVNKIEKLTLKKAGRVAVPKEFGLHLKNLDKRMKSLKQGIPKANVCKKCGAVLNPKAKFCGKCGAKV